MGKPGVTPPDDGEFRYGEVPETKYGGEEGNGRDADETKEGRATGLDGQNSPASRWNSPASRHVTRRNSGSKKSLRWTRAAAKRAVTQTRQRSGELRAGRDDEDPTGDAVVRSRFSRAQTPSEATADGLLATARCSTDGAWSRWVVHSSELEEVSDVEVESPHGRKQNDELTADVS